LLLPLYSAGYRQAGVHSSTRQAHRCDAGASMLGGRRTRERWVKMSGNGHTQAQRAAYRSIVMDRLALQCGGGVAN
jgi:hypothetical protein